MAMPRAAARAAAPGGRGPGRSAPAPPPAGRAAAGPAGATATATGPAAPAGTARWGTADSRPGPPGAGHEEQVQADDGEQQQEQNPGDAAVLQSERGVVEPVAP